MTSAHEVVAAYWAAAEARDWNWFGELVAEQVVYPASQTRERVRGRTASGAPPGTRTPNRCRKSAKRPVS
jgi:hypothetical protein